MAKHFNNVQDFIAEINGNPLLEIYFSQNNKPRILPSNRNKNQTYSSIDIDYHLGKLFKDSEETEAAFKNIANFTRLSNDKLEVFFNAPKDVVQGAYNELNKNHHRCTAKALEKDVSELLNTEFPDLAGYVRVSYQEGVDKNSNYLQIFPSARSASYDDKISYWQRNIKYPQTLNEIREALIEYQKLDKFRIEKLEQLQALARNLDESHAVEYNGDGPDKNGLDLSNRHHESLFFGSTYSAVKSKNDYKNIEDLDRLTSFSKGIYFNGKKYHWNEKEFSELEQDVNSAVAQKINVADSAISIIKNEHIADACIEKLVDTHEIKINGKTFKFDTAEQVNDAERWALDNGAYLTHHFVLGKKLRDVAKVEAWSPLNASAALCLLSGGKIEKTRIEDGYSSEGPKLAQSRLGNGNYTNAGDMYQDFADAWMFADSDYIKDKTPQKIYSNNKEFLERLEIIIDDDTKEITQKIRNDTIQSIISDPTFHLDVLKVDGYKRQETLTSPLFKKSGTIYDIAKELQGINNSKGINSFPIIVTVTRDDSSEKHVLKCRSEEVLAKIGEIKIEDFISLKELQLEKDKKADFLKTQYEQEMGIVEGMASSRITPDLVIKTGGIDTSKIKSGKVNEVC